MFCNKCGNRIIEGDKYCQNCGQPVMPIGVSSTQQQVKQKKKGLPVWAIVLIVLGVMFILFVGGIVLIGVTTYNTITDISSELIEELPNYTVSTTSLITSEKITIPATATSAMIIEDVFTIAKTDHTALVVTGTINVGTIKKGDIVNVITSSGIITSTVVSIELFQIEQDSATVGQNVGVELSGLTREDVESGDIIAIMPN